MEGSWQEFWTRRRLTVSGVGLVLLVGVASCAVMGMGNAPGAAAFVLGATNGSAGSSDWLREPGATTTRPHYRRPVPDCPRRELLVEWPGQRHRSGRPEWAVRAVCHRHPDGSGQPGLGGGRRGPECSRDPGQHQTGHRRRRLRIEPGRRWRRSGGRHCGRHHRRPLRGQRQRRRHGRRQQRHRRHKRERWWRCQRQQRREQEQRREWNRRRCQQQLGRRGRHGHRWKR